MKSTRQSRIAYNTQPKGNYWYFVFRKPGEIINTWLPLRTKDELTATREAEKLSIEIDREYAEGTKISEIMDDWLKYNSRKSEWYKKDVKKYYPKFVEFFNDRKANSLTKIDLYEYKTYLENQKKKNGEPFSETYICGHLRIVKALWNWAMDIPKYGIEDRNIFRRFDIGKVKERIFFLSYPELETFYETAKKHNYLDYLFLRIITENGLRIGEYFNLRHNDIWDEHIKLGETKPDRASQTIKLRDEVRGYLEELKSLQKKCEYVYSDRNGKHLQYTDLSKMPKKYFREIGLSDFRAHDLRHTYATILISKGTDIREVQQLLRHKNIATTMKYVHWVKDHIPDERASIFRKPTFKHPLTGEPLQIFETGDN